jgi:predicted methyltransferase
MVAFAGVKPGSKVADLLPGGGYFTRVFAAAVGPTGKVYAWLPSQAPAAYQNRLDPIINDPAYANVTLLRQTAPEFTPPEPLDVVFTAQNYHDLHNNGQTPAALNAAIFKALKPGGVYVVVDHAAKPGSGVSETNTLHRIDPEAVKAEVTRAGFKFDGESTVLRRSDDPRTAKVFELHDKTDQFARRFKKPG